MNNRYLLSIVIPTRNRQSVLLKSLIQIFDNITDEIQVVIQDNSDDDRLRNEISRIGYKNIVYNYTKKRLSFVENFNTAISFAEGKYLCMIGDDDGICAEIIDVVKWAEKNDFDSIIPNIDFEYFWPNSIRLYNMNSNGLVRILKSKLKVKYVNTECGVVNVLKNGCQNYTKYNVVKLYHGIVKKESLEKVYRIAGKYFGGVSPDIYVSIALSLVCKNNVRITTPVTIAGVCKNSGSADSSNGKHIGKFKDMPHLNGHTDYEWSNLVPKFYSVETVWADSAIKAIVDMERDDLLEYYNFSALDAVCKIKYGDYSNLLDRNNSVLPLKNFSYSIIIEKVKYYCRKIYWRLSRIRKKLIVQNNIEDLSEAYEIYKETNYFSVTDILKVEEIKR